MTKDQPAAEKQPQPAKAQPKTKPKTQTKKPSASKSKSKALTVRQSAVEKPINLENLIGKAITKGNLDVVERLLAVRKELKAEWAKEQYYTALSKFQKECPLVLKLEKIMKGNLVRSRYAPMPDIVKATKDLLEKHGFSTTYKQDNSLLKDGFVGITAYPHHVAGHTEESTVFMPTEVSKGSSGEAIMNAQQQIGSARMYALRIAHCNAYGIVTVDPDDDAMSAGETTGGADKVTRTVEPEQPESNEGINSLCDRILSKLRSGAFPEEVRNVLEKRCMEIHKQGSIKPLVAFEENIDRQIKFKRRQQDGSSEGS